MLQHEGAATVAVCDSVGDSVIDGVSDGAGVRSQVSEVSSVNLSAR